MAASAGQCLRLLLLLISVFVYAIEGRNSPRLTEPRPTHDDQFDWMLIKHIFLQDSGNVVVSTFSVKFLLNMLYEGTSVNSSTQQELSDPLGRSPNIRKAPQCAKIMRKLAKNADKFSISNRVFTDSMVSVSQNFAAILKKRYNASVNSIDFHEPEIAADTINSWVSKSTRGMFPNFVTPEDLEDTNMILMNAIHFKGLWVKTFTPISTTVHRFYTASAGTVHVPFMEQTEEHYYVDSEELNAQLIRLPYSHGKFSMIIVLPSEESNLTELLNAITSKSINAAISSMVNEKVELQLPRFHIKYKGSLKEKLQQLGINRIFEEDAELELMFPSGVQAKVSDVLQKTVLVVDEQGSTASSVTAGMVMARCGSQSEMFTANRPFMFFIEEEASGTIVFAGKVENPAQ